MIISLDNIDDTKSVAIVPTDPPAGDWIIY
jgi:hypothetical protein